MAAHCQGLQPYSANDYSCTLPMSTAVQCQCLQVHNANVYSRTVQQHALVLRHTDDLHIPLKFDTGVHLQVSESLSDSLAYWCVELEGSQ